ncbi:four helix bundle protein [Sinomicrobium oceani]|uniref:four helix bundle protein n=1 Tax=Sinomicrobium oceani TaxID=1150368 RepID=UPI0009F87F93|nr:four helix bundle protein [Sinomicrobium oceani]
MYIRYSKIPDNEKFGISSQIKRSSVSVPSNIAEEAGRNSEDVLFVQIKNLTSQY